MEAARIFVLSFSIYAEPILLCAHGLHVSRMQMVLYVSSLFSDPGQSCLYVKMKKERRGY